MTLSMFISVRSMAKPLCMLSCFALVLTECIFLSVICSALSAARALCCLHTVSALCVAGAMDLMEELHLHDQIARGGTPRQRGVTVTLEADWFRMTGLRTKKPSALSVDRYWAILKQPLDETCALQSLYMIKRALLDWPSMGAAIAKRASKEWVHAMLAKKHLKRAQLQKDNRARVKATKRVLEVGHGVGNAKTQNSAKKGAGKVLRCMKKTSK
jgi:hypothetical protein